MFETRSQSWLDAGLLIDEVDKHAVRRARRRGTAFLVLFVGMLIAGPHLYSVAGVPSAKSADANGWTTTIQWGIAVVLLVLGWALAAEVGRAVGPSLFRRMDPATAGTVGFFARLLVLVIVLFVALDNAGINPAALTIGASFLAIIFGLAAQQTLGNVFAGVVLLSARPFRVGERVRLQAGGVGGQLEGVVSSLGLLYTAFASGEDLTMVPNSVVLNSAVVPLREPDSVDLRARLRPGVTPRQLQRLLDASIETPLRDSPRITLEELDGDEVVVRIVATPRHAVDGPALATEVLEVVARETRAAEERADGDGAPPARGRTPAVGTSRPDAPPPAARGSESPRVDGEADDADAAAITVVRPPAGDRAERG